DQTGSSWVFQAQDMDRHFLGIHWLESQIQAINPLLILTFIPLFTMFVYPAIDRVFKLTPLRKIGIGLFLAAASFALVTLVQAWIDAGQRPSVAWQLIAHALLTAGEVMVSIVALEFSYTQAPKKMKSMIMAVFLLAVWFGNTITSQINKAIIIPNATSEELAVGFDEKKESGDEVSEPNKDDEHALHQFKTEGLNEQFAKLLTMISEKTEKDGKLPATGSIELPKDSWGNPFRYQQTNSLTARLSSDGPDGKQNTRWDLNMTLSLPDPEPEESESWADALHPEKSWLDSRKKELGIDEKPESEKPYFFKVKSTIGGGSTLAGASYFRFFTYLMLGTALVFIPFAFFYKERTYLQS
ncbi:MAG: MFS transporter, partial [Akkermansiaceae bacterium]